MNVILGTLLASVLMLHFAAAAKEHQCWPIGINEHCILEYVFYEEGDNEVHIFPKNHSYILIHGRIRRTSSETSHIWRFDSKLHAELGRPPSVDMIRVGMKELEIPRSLQVGGFTENKLEWFNLEQGEMEPAMSYLDLSNNPYRNLTNITSLINLQTLCLVGNDITSLESAALNKLPKLKLLDMSYNRLLQLSARQYPPSLVDLHLYHNSIKTLNYSDIDFANLELINLEHNELEEVDASALLLAIPKLNIILLGGNHFSYSYIKPALEIFKRHNVTVKVNTEEGICRYDAVEFEDLCIRRAYVEKSKLAATGFSILTIIIAAGMLLLVRWVFIAMTK